MSVLDAKSVAPLATLETEESIPLLLSEVTRMFWRRLEGAMRADGLDFTAGEARALVHAFKAASLRQTSLAERMHGRILLRAQKEKGVSLETEVVIIGED